MRVIPNENTWVGVTSLAVPNLSSIPVATITAATDLTDFLISLTASSTGNTVPTPSLKRLFETSIPGTSAAQFTADFYRDDETDTAWDMLIRGFSCTFLISRFAGTGTAGKPAIGNKLEAWPVQVTSRSAGALSSNTAQIFTVTGSVPREPGENAVVVA